MSENDAWLLVFEKYEIKWEFMFSERGHGNDLWLIKNFPPFPIFYF